MVTVEDVRRLAATLPRSSEHLIRDRVKFRVGSIVYVAFSRDETVMGFAFPKEERAALVAAEPATFLLPPEGDLRFNWVCARMAALDLDEAHELVLEAWRMVVPKKVYADHLAAHPDTVARPVPGSASMPRAATPDRATDPEDPEPSRARPKQAL